MANQQSPQDKKEQVSAERKPSKSDESMNKDNLDIDKDTDY